MWHELKTCVDFRFLPKVWCSMRERNLHWAREEKCFQFEHWELREIASEHRMTPCFGPGSCEKSIIPVSRKWKSRRETIGRAMMSSTQHLSQFSVPQEDVETTSARHSRDARVQDWKHFSSSHNTAKQRRFFSRMEHQTFDENLKSTEVFNSCRIWGLLFYEYFFTYHCVWFLVR
jgi:hypothetical protein